MDDKQEGLLNFLIGVVMKKSNGTANPKIVKQLLLERLEKDEDK